jgi:hypothetical protein
MAALERALAAEPGGAAGACVHARAFLATREEVFAAASCAGNLTRAAGGGVLVAADSPAGARAAAEPLGARAAVLGGGGGRASAAEVVRGVASLLLLARSSPAPPHPTPRPRAARERTEGIACARRQTEPRHRVACARAGGGGVPDAHVAHPPMRRRAQALRCHRGIQPLDLLPPCRATPALRPPTRDVSPLPPRPPHADRPLLPLPHLSAAPAPRRIDVQGPRCVRVACSVPPAPPNCRAVDASADVEAYRPGAAMRGAPLASEGG